MTEPGNFSSNKRGRFSRDCLEFLRQFLTSSRIVRTVPHLSERRKVGREDLELGDYLEQSMGSLYLVMVMAVSRGEHLDFRRFLRHEPPQL